ncbi:hypothetical protein PV327_011629 [Microctonus hyperodae]|uniref:Uncharacterized protein n=1 Tax=Microctonus hyperodae TaxID=165561 RepID=A0AA39C2E3_MICHY|nr:hypothetical protein PV327_011629 [Microctonus hyperodae]
MVVPPSNKILTPQERTQVATPFMGQMVMSPNKIVEQRESSMTVSSARIPIVAPQGLTRLRNDGVISGGKIRVTEPPVSRMFVTNRTFVRTRAPQPANEEALKLISVITIPGSPARPRGPETPLLSAAVATLTTIEPAPASATPTTSTAAPTTSGGKKNRKAVAAIVDMAYGITMVG